MAAALLPWVAFTLFVLVMLAVDLGIFHRRAHAVGMREAITWSVVWTILALLFNLGLSAWRGQVPALEFFAGYLIERSLSVDNLFVFVVIFAYFQVAPQYQHAVLYWGILGALVMRALFIAAGIALIHAVSWITYVFGGLLLLTAVKLLVQEETGVRPERNPLVKAFRRFVPMTPDYHGRHFVVRQQGRVLATPLLLVLLVVETTDLIFAVDSIPAILAVTTDPFVVYTSNVFAILGLRALYFVLAGLMRTFHYLQLGLAVILGFVGAKMLLTHVYPIPIGTALGIIGGVLAASVLASWLWPPRRSHS